MATKATRYVDNQGRVVLPSHIREALNLAPGNVVTVELDDDGTIRMRASQERCCVCGEGMEDKPCAEIEANGKKRVCYKCAQAIARDMIRRA